MASNGATPHADYGPVLVALATMQGNVERAQKTQAHEYLEKFQKSQQAWTSTHAMLRSPDATTESKLFAATTLKGKVNYDLDQVPRESLPALRQTILSLVALYRTGPRPIRIQLCVCLAILAIQMTEWKDVIQTVVAEVGTDAEGGTCLLEFLRVLPEEATTGRKTLLTDEELDLRIKELLSDNAANVLQLLTQYAQSSSQASTDPRLLECITSWLREIPVDDVVTSPLLTIIIDALSASNGFEAAVDCLCAIFKDTREVDAYLSTIQVLLPRIVAMQPKIAQIMTDEDLDTFKGLTRLFAEAGEAWVVLIARMPQQFRPLVECVLECAARDRDREAVSLTFNFWYEMKMYLVLEKYIEARMQFADVFSRLDDIMLKHLEYPKPEDDDESDLFDGDRELEEKFREFRHAMGDVLKDCCEVIGVTECLSKSFRLIQQWVTRYGAQATNTHVPNWQELEAPLFSLRAMGRTVGKEENIILPQIMPLLVQVPEHEKVRFAAIMALGRYTEWTAEHPDFLEPQLNFIINAFSHPSKEVVRAAALSLRYFCQDCRHLLRDHAIQLQKFYDSVLDGLPQASQEEVTEGVACIVSGQPSDKLYDIFKLYCDPLLKRLMAKANAAQDEKGKLAVADHLQLLTVFISMVTPYVEPSAENPAVKYCQEIFPVLGTIVDNFLDFSPICERICRCWREMVLSYRTATKPMLPALADKLVSCFAASKQGCFLWTTDAIVREFSEGAEFVDRNTSDAIYHFCEQQIISMLRALNNVPPEDLPDVIEDFFRLLIDTLLYYPAKLVPSPLFPPILSAALTALTLQQVPPLTATLHFLRDALGYGGDNPPQSSLTGPDDKAATPDDLPAIRQAVQKLMLAEGELLTQRVLTGMMFTFPKDCFPDASGVLLGLVELVQVQITPWIARTVQMVPAGTVSQAELQKLLGQIEQRIRDGEIRKVRYLIQDFCNSYRRRNVAPRDGLGRLEAARFRFSG
ncbi:MAG: Nuclear import receptor [Caeruleum heppii]|nr:MAG: Nuclear import receptor [Caeruleum heppii]